MEQLYSSTQLLDYMGKHGLPKSRQWLYHNEERGKLVCPRRPHKRKDRAFTLVQMEEIVKAFSPGGPGYWRHNETA
jgi:hypothetical protein